MLRDVLWIEDAAPHRRGTFKAAILEGESQSASAGPSLDGITANPWTLRVPCAHPDNALAAYVRMGDELTIEPGVTLSVQQATRTPYGFIIIRATTETRAPLND